MTRTALGPILGLGIMVSVGSLALPARGEDAEAVKLADEGERILAQNCARCHATGMTGDSPHAEAPAFRTLSRKYPIRNLAEALAEGITTGHPDMPEFVFSADEIAAIIAHMERISDVPPK